MVLTSDRVTRPSLQQLLNTVIFPVYGEFIYVRLAEEICDLSSRVNMRNDYLAVVLSIRL